MTKHFHVIFGQGYGSLGDVQYENYEDSVKDFVNFSVTLFHSQDEGANLTLQNAFEATSSTADNMAVVVGAPNLQIFWRTCDEENCTTCHMN